MTDTIGDVEYEFDEQALGTLRKVTDNEQSMRARIIKQARAWTVDETTEGGAWLLTHVRELSRQPIVNPRKPPTTVLDLPFILTICPREYEEDATCFEVPIGASLVKRGKDAYQLMVGDKSICLGVRRDGRLKLGRHSGFRKDASSAQRHPSAQAMMRVVYTAS